MGSYRSDAFVSLHIGPGVREDLDFLAYCGLVNEDLQIPCANACYGTWNCAVGQSDLLRCAIAPRSESWTEIKVPLQYTPKMRCESKIRKLGLACGSRVLASRIKPQFRHWFATGLSIRIHGHLSDLSP